MSRKSNIMPEAEFVPLLNKDEEDSLLNTETPDELGILPLRNTVLYPGIIIPITAGRNKSITLLREAYKDGKLLGVTAQKNIEEEDPTADDIYSVGTVAKILKMINLPDGEITVIMQGLRKLEIVEMLQEEPYFKAKIKLVDDNTLKKKDKEYNAIIDNIRDVALDIIEKNSAIRPEAGVAINSIESPSFLVNFVSSNLHLSLDQKQELLKTSDLKKRSIKTLKYLNIEREKLELKNDIQLRTKSDMDKQQREYYLNQQLKTIQNELGGSQTEEIDDLRVRAEEKVWSKTAQDTFDKALGRMERLNSHMPEYSIQRNYLEFMLDLPWEHYSKDDLNLKRAQKILDRDHFGLEEVKERIIEYLAVLKLKKDMKAPIICLYGPPGVGKTSLGKSIAASLKREYIRMSLGGLHDESEIRGHRKTYIGAMAGRLLQSIKKAGTGNPVFVLDEIDKMGTGSHGDPTSAMLEVLDPEQNNEFYDNYLEIGYDLSSVMFIATANDISNIPAPLRDRMEMVKVSGYTIEEKKQIAKKFLIPKQIEEHGLTKKQFKLGLPAIEYIIESYTRESGVRTLEKRIAKLIRNRAAVVAREDEFKPSMTKEDITKILGPAMEANRYEGNDVPGVVTGLAWTSVGGDILYIESILSHGKGNLSLTGNLGKVMKESAQIAMEYIKAHNETLNIPLDKIKESNVHVHVPAGAIPKDGPSAGITMLTSIVSTFTERKVKPNLAMTGEITLRGKVLPVGGIKEKILAAKRANIKEIILCEANRKDVEDIKQEYLKGLTFHYTDDMQEVLRIALLDEPNNV